MRRPGAFEHILCAGLRERVRRRSARSSTGGEASQVSWLEARTGEPPPLAGGGGEFIKGEAELIMRIAKRAGAGGSRASPG